MVQVVHQGIGGLVALGCGDVLGAVDGQAHGLAEVGAGQHDGVGVALGGVHGLQALQAAVEEEGHGEGVVHLVQTVGGSEGENLFRRGGPLGQLTLQEGLLGGGVVHYVYNDGGGSILRHGLAVHFKVGHRQQGAVLLLFIAVPVFVLHEHHLLVGLQGNQLVGAVGHGVLNGGAVVGGGQGTGGIHASFVVGLVYQPGVGAADQEVVEIDVLGGYIADGVVIHLVAADGGVIVAHIADLAGIDEQGFLQQVVLLGLVGDVEQAGQDGLNNVFHNLAVFGGYLGVAVGVLIGGQLGDFVIQANAVFLVQIGQAHAVQGHAVRADVDIDHAVGNALVQIVGVIGGFAVAIGGNHHIIDGGTRVVVGQAARNSGLTGIVQVGAVVLHLGVEQLLHGVDVIISSDGFAVFPLGIGVELDFIHIALFGGVGGIALAQRNAVLGQIVAMLGGDVLDGGGHFIDPLIDAVFGVLDGHVAEANGEIALQDGLIRIGFPGVGVPVVAQGGAIRMIRIGGGGFSCGGFGQSGAAGQQHAQRQDDG